MTILVSDAELRDAFRRGERNALKRVYREYAGELFGFLSRGFAIQAAGGNHYFTGYNEPWRLETAVQDVFSKAFSERARMGYDGIRPFKNYLFTIARNHIVDLFRKKPKEFLPLEDIPESTANDALTDSGVISDVYTTPEEKAEEKQLGELVEQYLGTLDKKQKAIFEVRFSEGKSIEACAKTLGVTDYRIKREETRIKKSFFHFMSKHGYFKGYRFSELGVQQCIVAMLVLYGAVQC